MCVRISMFHRGQLAGFGSFSFTMGVPKAQISAPQAQGQADYLMGLKGLFFTLYNRLPLPII